MLHVVRSRAACSLSRLRVIAAIALPLLAVAASPARGAETTGTVVLSSATIGAWQVIASRDADGVDYCIARRELGGTGIDQPRLFEFIRTKRWRSLRIAADAWTLPRDVVLPLTIAAGERVRGRSEAKLFSPNSLYVGLGDLLATLDRIADAPAIEVRMADRTLTLPLADVPAMRAAFASCITGRLGAEHAGISVRYPVFPRDPDVEEEHLMLPVRIGGETYRLDTLVVRPAGVRGRLPIALIGHGQGNAEVTTVYSVMLMQRQARDLAQRGYLAVVLIRRSFGRSDGIPGLPGGAPHSGCEPHVQTLLDTTADDLGATLAAISERPDADPERVILIGQSAAGPGVLALAARGLPGLRAIVMISGGMRCGQGDSPQRSTPRQTPDWFARMLATFGARVTVPSLWIYASNDSFFSDAMAREMHAAYTGAGAPGNFVMVGGLGEDGHNLFTAFEGRQRWLAALDMFLQRHGLPTWSNDLVDRVVRQGGIAPANRYQVLAFLWSVTPRALVVDRATGRMFRAAMDSGLDDARAAAMMACLQAGGTVCRVLMENFRLRPAVATEARTVR
jgi:dienelactone hydrolase